MAKSILIDSGFWFAFFDNRDQYHEEALIYYEYFAHHTLVLPWPTMYETLNTRFSRRHVWVNEFLKIKKRHNILFVDDRNYREPALELFLSIYDKPYKPFSLVDIVIRNILDDFSLKIDSIVTFNRSDFIDVCHKRQIEIFKG